MEGGSLNSMEQKGKAKAANVMDVQEPTASLNKDVKISEENPEKESTVEGSSCYAGEDAQQQNEPSPVALVNSGGDDTAGSASVSISNPPPRNVEKNGQTLTDKSSPHTCKYCKKMFSTAQALGGHQNTHRYARELAKKPRVEAHTPPPVYANYGGSPNSFSFGHPKLPLYYSNNFTTLPRPPFPYLSHALFGFPTIQFSQSTTGLTIGNPGQPSDMLNSRQLPVFNRPRNMIMPNSVYNINANYTYGNFNIGETVVGGQGGILEGFGAPNSNNNSMGAGLNSMGIGGVRGTNLDGYFPSVGFETTGTSRGVVRNFFGLSQGVIGHDESDGTIDLLSRVGMGRAEDEESNGKGGNGDGES